MLRKLQTFFANHLGFVFQPKFILTNNCDTLITGCKNSFTHPYIHLGCHFHIAKRMKEKSQSGAFEDKKKLLFFGLKCLKNSPTLSFFQRVWKIVREYWKNNDIPNDFIETFNKEYIQKNVQ